MENQECPVCTVNDILEYASHFECVTCAHEWGKSEEAEKEEVFEVKDAFGNVLADGDIIQMIKDKKLKGSSEVLKSGTKSKAIRLVEDSDHQISTRMNGMSIMLKAEFVKKIL